MARYCFYCGRELYTGDKCNCRSNDKAQSTTQSSAENASGYAYAAGSTSSAGTASEKTTTQSARKNRPKGKKFSSFFQSFNPFAANTGTQQSARSQSRPKARPVTPRQKPSPRTTAPLNLQTILQYLRRFGLYLARPADSVRSAVQNGSRRSALGLLVLLGACSGLFLLTAANRISSILPLFVVSNALADNVLMFAQGFLIAVGASLLLTILYYLALRFLYRQPVAFFDLLIGFAPSTLYLSLFILLGVLSMAGSIFGALMMLLVGAVVAVIAQYLALSKVSGFDDNRNIILITFVMMIYTSVLAMLLNLTLPILQALLESTRVI